MDKLDGALEIDEINEDRDTQQFRDNENTKDIVSVHNDSILSLSIEENLGYPDPVFSTTPNNLKDSFNVSVIPVYAPSFSDTIKQRTENTTSSQSTTVESGVWDVLQNAASLVTKAAREAEKQVREML